MSNGPGFTTTSPHRSVLTTLAPAPSSAWITVSLGCP